MKKQLSFQEKLLKMTKQQKKKTNKHVFIALPIVFCLMFVFMWAGKAQTPSVKTYSDDLVSASFVGDIMMGRYVEKVTEQKGTKSLFQYVEPIFKASDYVAGNFENPVTYKKNYTEADKNIHLQANKDSVKVLKDMNFTVLTGANNHAMDYGVQGMKDTLEEFSKQNLDLVGAGSNLKEAENRISYQEVNGVKIATLGFTDVYGKNFTARKNTPGVLPADPEIFIPMISKAKKNADIVVVQAHWGQEYDNDPNDRQRELGRAMSDAGADIIIGHHPHVLEPIEVYNGTVIFYSLGNFVFDQGWTRTRDSALVQYHLKKNGTGHFEVTPINIHEATPAPVKKGGLKEKTIIRELTKDSNFVWDVEDGKLTFDIDHTDKLKSKTE
ncbi:capsular biosynthesis protein [Bacillus atrophaeus]|uniref:Capsular polyglutamate synthetase n=1 Tax=Bacillus atrophaeus (strain 1942) TaxID=720555 RepID=A0ABM5M1P2_BACA1|nr:capsular polyglutamate synthetase PgsA [Bacillus atrophaeus]AMR61228.1 capsular biosynthesis protein [Bacillus subtilis subsp. globigii]BBA91546.1 poly(gamma-glutamic acid) synthase PgsA [Bacillus sp. (in: firmicutes)]ADP34085.1 capsular polyglutamate synthetase [Bacillus atrophaeus 1942]AIK47245.1 bacterial capsule synthesis PGA_cap family protein [Bacillus atrophaeus subsp. globigii]AKL86576.1 YwtB [Bacillus atrophaeus UCMB-5137]